MGLKVFVATVPQKYNGGQGVKFTSYLEEVTRSEVVEHDVHGA
jgi:hypothetical protein